MSKTENKNNNCISVYISSDVYEALKEHCDEYGYNMNEKLDEAIIELLDIKYDIRRV